MVNSIGFIGAGQMAEALIRGILNAFPEVKVHICDVNESRLSIVSKISDSISVQTGPGEVVEASEITFVAVKPYTVSKVLQIASAHLKSCESIEDSTHRVIVSIAAGVTLAALEADLPEGTAVVRVMPNVCCLVSAAASALCPGTSATPADTETVKQLLSAVGVAVVVPEEKYMDVVTGVSGSGPGYVSLMIEALIDGGVFQGLPRPLARDLAVQTFIGTGQYLQRHSGLHPAALRDAVTSPGGTTAAGLQALEDGGVRSAIVAAVRAAVQRAEELSGEK